MSTDDLTRRARAAARGLKPTLSGTSALVSELADEVDRLRGERDRWKARSVTAGADLDAARAALERGIEEAQCWIDDRAGRAILNALEGEPS